MLKELTVPRNSPSFALNSPESSETPVPGAVNENKGQKLWAVGLPASSVIILKPRSDPLSLLLQNLRQVSCLLSRCLLSLTLKIFHSRAPSLSSLSPTLTTTSQMLQSHAPHLPPKHCPSHTSMTFFVTDSLLMPTPPTTPLPPGEFLLSFKLKLEACLFCEACLDTLPPCSLIFYVFLSGHLSQCVVNFIGLAVSFFRLCLLSCYPLPI